MIASAIQMAAWRGDGVGMGVHSIMQTVNEASASPNRDHPLQTNSPNCRLFVNRYSHIQVLPHPNTPTSQHSHISHYSCIPAPTNPNTPASQHPHIPSLLHPSTHTSHPSYIPAPSTDVTMSHLSHPSAVTYRGPSGSSKPVVLVSPHIYHTPPPPPHTHTRTHARTHARTHNQPIRPCHH